MSTFKVPVVSIKSLEPIQGADRIELAKFHQNDWQIVVQKGYKVGDLVAYVPPDSCFTDEIVQKLDLKYLKNGNRVGAIKLRGVYSFGMVLPVPEGFGLGTDCSEYYQITKWVEPEKTYNITRSGAQGTGWKAQFSKYTDIENSLSYPDVFTTGEYVSITEKIHGSNAMFGWVKNPKPALWERIPFIDRIFPNAGWIFIACSRNNQYDITKYQNLWTKIAIKYDLPNKLRYMRNYMICGEIYGAGVQDLTYGEKGQEFVAFDILSVDKDNYIAWESAKNVLASLGLMIVPELYSGPYAPELISHFISGKSLMPRAGHQLREGIVIKPSNTVEYSEKLHGRKIVKLISPEYLSRKDGTEYK